jgi:MFS family permease
MEPVPAPPGRIRREAFRALRHRNFRLLLTGTILSQTGDFLQIMAQGWLVITLTGSPLSLGVVGFCQSVPRLALGVVAGMLADRFERRRLLFLSQAGMMIQSLLFAVLVSTGRITYGQILGLTLVWGALNAINQTARASLIPALVPREEMLNAIAIHSSGFNLTRGLGPALGGALVGLLGVAGCLWINAASFIPMLWALRAMEFGPAPHVDRASAPSLTEAIGFIRRERDVLVAIGLTYAIAFFALPYSRLLPAFARDVFHSGPGGYGILMAAGGVGAVTSTLALATWGRAELFSRLLPVGTIFLGIALVAFVSSPGLWTGALFLLVFGALQLGLRTVAATIIQTRAPDDLRGRVTGIFLMDIGVWSLGTLAIAALAEILGVRAGVGIGAALCVGSGVLALRAYPRKNRSLPPDLSA